MWPVFTRLKEHLMEKTDDMGPGYIPPDPRLADMQEKIDEILSSILDFRERVDEMIEGLESPDNPHITGPFGGE